MLTPAKLTTPLSGLSRRQILGAMGALGTLGLMGCGGSDNPLASTTSTDSTASNTSSSSSSTSSSSTSSTTSSSSSAATTTTSSSSTTSSTSTESCVVIPQETQGPYPLLAILTNSSMVRQAINESKTGVPLTVKIKLVNVNDGCRPLTNTAVYIWHCDKDGQYSGYSSSQNGYHAGETFCRGIQVTDSNGEVSFTTIYPGWYAGRITHIHFQAYLGNNLNVSAIATSQMAFPQDITKAVYNSTLYSSRGQNTSVTSFSADNIFSDGTTYQMATLTGDVTNGFVATLTVGIAA